MVTFLRRLVILVIGIALLVAPMWVRDGLWHYNVRPYVPPVVPTLAVAATPFPTAVPTPVDDRSSAPSSEFRAGPVVLDLAHYNSINPSSLQPLADALAGQGIGLRYWLSKVDALSVTSYLEYPDQSEELANELADASALIIISPFFLWSPEEIALVEEFVADGGRLLLISDPDISGDYAAATNMIGEPFGVVFNEDYLYDTTNNDGNFTFFFQEAATTNTATTGAATTITDTDTSTLSMLADSTIAFYGGRSLSGDLQAVLQSVDTTLSSLRVGRNHFTTAAVAGIAATGTAGRVLAMSDLDVLTEPYRQRYDNQKLVDYVAGFLSADQRVKRVVDFPDYLGKDVALAFGASAAINADLIMQGAQIQLALETSGRTLSLTDSRRLTNTTSTATTTSQPDASATGDLIYLADYTIAISKTTILDDLGIELYREVVTKTVPVATATPVETVKPQEDSESTPEATPDPAEDTTGDATGDTTEDSDLLPLPTLTPSPILTPSPTLTPALTTTTPFTATGTVTGTIESTGTVESANAQNTPSVQLTQTVTATPAAITDDAALTVEITATATTTVTATDLISTTGTPTETVSVTPTFEVRTVITTYLQLPSGLTFLAEETVLIVQKQQANGTTLLAVLAANNLGIDTGVKRLLENDFSGCLIGEPLTFCALEKTGGSSTSSASSAETGTDTTGSDTPQGDTMPDGEQMPPRGANAPVLLIDDNGAASPTELSEADLYLQVLIAGGYEVDLWSIIDQGEPTVDDLMAYGWVIWSNGGYASGEIDGGDLETLFSFINNNGRITVSSRVPLPGLEESAPLRDLVSENTIPPLVVGLPTDSIPLNGGETTASVLSALAEGDEATQVVLRRGPDSEQSDAPALVVLADPSGGDSEARLMIVAFSLTWLPAAEQSTLINNMASWMLMP